MPEFELNGKKVDFKSGETVYQVAKRLGIHIPVYCYHPNLRIVASCRVCLVEMEVDGRRGLKPACATQAQEGLKVWTDSPLSQRARKDILEFLLLSHPVECPTCDEGGRCDLQDFTRFYGNPTSRLTYLKRVFPRFKTEPFIKFYPNRCILCDRCVRFYNEELNNGEWLLYNRGHETVVGPFLEKSVIKSGFAGYIIDICPVGAILDKTILFGPRPWDLDIKRTTCFLCSTHCGMDAYIINERRTRVRRSGIKERHNRVYKVRHIDDEENPGILCDRGKFAKDFVASRSRLSRCKVDGKVVGHNNAVQKISEKFLSIYRKYGPQGIGVVISPRDTNENAELFNEFLKKFGISNTVFTPGEIHSGTENIHSDFNLQDLNKNTLIIHLGEEIFNTHPVLGFEILRRVRRAVLSCVPPAHWIPDLGKELGEAPLLASFHYYYGKTYKSADFPFIVKPGEEKEIVLSILSILREKYTFHRETPFINLFDLDLAIQQFDRNNVFKRFKNLEVFKELLDRSSRLVLIFNDTLPSYLQKLLYVIKFLHPDTKILCLRQAGNTEGFLNRNFALIPFDRLLEYVKIGQVQGVLFFRTNPFLELFPRNGVEEIFKRCEVLTLDTFEGKHTERADAILPVPSLFEEQGTLLSNLGERKELNRVIEPYEGNIPINKVLKYLLRFVPEGISEPKLKDSFIVDLDVEEKTSELYLLGSPFFFDEGYEPQFSEIFESLKEKGVSANPYIIEKFNLVEGEKVGIETTAGKAEIPIHSDKNLPTHLLRIPHTSLRLNITSIFTKHFWEPVKLKKLTT